MQGPFINSSSENFLQILSNRVLNNFEKSSRQKFWAFQNSRNEKLKTALNTTSFHMLSGFPVALLAHDYGKLGIQYIQTSNILASYPKQPLFNACFNWMLNQINYMENSWTSPWNHPFFQLLAVFTAPLVRSKKHLPFESSKKKTAKNRPYFPWGPHPGCLWFRDPYDVLWVLWNNPGIYITG